MFLQVQQDTFTVLRLMIFLRGCPVGKQSLKKISPAEAFSIIVKILIHTHNNIQFHCKMRLFFRVENTITNLPFLSFAPKVQYLVRKNEMFYLLSLHVCLAFIVYQVGQQTEGFLSPLLLLLLLSFCCKQPRPFSHASSPTSHFSNSFYIQLCFSFLQPAFK